MDAMVGYGRWFWQAAQKVEKSLELRPASREFARSFLVGYSSGQRGQTVNLLTNVFDGSNPSPTTTSARRKKQGPSGKCQGTQIVAERDENHGSTERSGEGARGSASAKHLAVAASQSISYHHFREAEEKSAKAGWGYFTVRLYFQKSDWS